MSVSFGEYFLGAAFLTFVLAVCVLAARRVVGRLLPGLRGAPRGLALFILGTAGLVAVHLVPFALGVLSAGSVAVAAVLLLVATWPVPRLEAVGEAPRPLDDPPRASTAMAAAGALAASAGALGFLAGRAGDPVSAVDALTVHLPQVARAIQSGSLQDLVQYTPDLSNATYPQNGTLMLLAAVLPWDSVFAVRLVNLPFLLAAAVAVGAAAREIGAPGTSAVLAAAAVTALPAVSEPGLEQAQVDAPMLAWFAAGSFFLIRAARSGSRPELALAGIGLGLAFGAKWYAVAYVPVLVAVWLLAHGVRCRRPSEAGILLGAIAAFGGAWLVRNLLLTGNPLHPAPLRVFGVTLFDAPPDPLRELAGFTVSDYLLDPGVWRRYLLPAWVRNFGLLGPILLAGLTAAAVSLASRRRPGDGGALGVIAAALAMGALYTVLPDTAFGLPGRPVLTGANARYLVPALLACAVAAAWLSSRLPRRRQVVEALLLLGVLEGIARSYRAEWGWVLAAAGGLVAAASFLRARRVAPRSLVVAAVTGAILLGLALSQTVRPAEHGRMDPVVAMLQASVPDRGRVGLAGTWSPDRLSPVLPAFGPRLRNRVDYLGRFVDGTLRRHTSAAPFRKQLRQGGYDAVVIGKGVPSAPNGENPEAGWARAAGYRQARESPHLVLFLPDGDR